MLLKFAKNRTVKLSESDDSLSDVPRRSQLDSDSNVEKTIDPIYPNAMKDYFKKSVLEQVRV